MSIQVSTHAAPPSRPREFTCAEVWGGNRQINSVVRLPGVRGKVFSRPSGGGRGGDVHYVSICGSGLISRFCVADVAGHGERVALVSDELHGLLNRLMDSPDQRRLLTALNQRLVSSDDNAMTTAASVTYFPPTRRLSVSYAGHPPAWLYRQRADCWERLMLDSAQDRSKEPIDLPLAIERHTVFTRRNTRVRPGDRRVWVTDGILEAPGPSGEIYGEARLDTLLQQNREASVEGLSDEILGSVAAHTGKGSFAHDDVTLFVLEFERGPAAMGMWYMLKNRLGGRRRP